MASSRVAPLDRAEAPGFDAGCTRCARLAGFLSRCRTAHPGYHNAPVAPFGVPRARLTVVGLAPGLHGANRSGRPFTGDFAGILLYATLHRHGFASLPTSTHVGDGLQLYDAYITMAVRCVVQNGSLKKVWSIRPK